ncbi:MAG: hypothetical protein BA865_08100 [Desulfobacterales bacterium S5133MH4]|nr:MAG: hypothetical protein BA865_08100 [Desulfobacterales bacterium S5133MH4]
MIQYSIVSTGPKSSKQSTRRDSMKGPSIEEEIIKGLGIKQPGEPAFLHAGIIRSSSVQKVRGDLLKRSPPTGN